MNIECIPDAGEYKPDPRLSSAYEEACRGDAAVLEAVCPSFSSLGDEAGRYQEETLIGQGGLKSVYRAYDHRTRRWVALARLRADRGLQYYDLFVREAWLVASLSHPNIIKVHDAGVGADGRPFFTMDLKGDICLTDLLDESSLAERLDIFQKVCDAVAYAHSRSVIHLDLKPDNIQCDRFGEVMVCDWGLCRSIEAVDEEPVFPLRSLDDMTLMGQIQGSLGYMAPEQVVPDQEKDQRTDVYALGCMLHTLLCGEPPFSGAMDEVLKATAASQITPLQARYPDRAIPEGLAAVVLKATAKDPADRYQSVENLAREIHNYLSGYATTAEQPGFFKRARLFIARNRLPVSIAVSAALVLSVLSILFGRQKMVTTEERERANRLLTEVNVISSDYQELSDQSAVSKKGLAMELAREANSVKNLGIFYQPAKTIKQANQLVEMALHLDPYNMFARVQRGSLLCLMLNYQDALLDIPQSDDRSQRAYSSLARAFPHYQFTGDIRPSADELVALFAYAHRKGLNVGGYLERVFTYHHSVAPIGQDLSRELEALFAFYNGGASHFSMNYDARAAALHIHSDQPALCFKSTHGGSGRSILRFIPFRSLTVDTTGAFDLRDVSGFPIETLDLSGCAEVLYTYSQTLPQLKKLIVRKGRVDESTWRNRLKSNDPFDLIER